MCTDILCAEPHAKEDGNSYTRQLFAQISIPNLSHTLLSSSGMSGEYPILLVEETYSLTQKVMHFEVSCISWHTFISISRGVSVLMHIESVSSFIVTAVAPS